jgi:predicted RND superfamily exporter protein
MLTFITLAVCSMVLSLLVPVNYNMLDYLPRDAQSTIAIRKMEEEIGGRIPTARVMIGNVTIQEALAFKEILALPPGCLGQMLDDIVGRES